MCAHVKVVVGEELREREKENVKQAPCSAWAPI